MTKLQMVGIYDDVQKLTVCSFIVITFTVFLFLLSLFLLYFEYLIS